MEYDYGHYEGLTADQIDAVQPGWNIWEDGCPGGESTDQVGSRADDFIQRYVDSSVAPVVLISHGHFSGPRRTGPETYGQHRALFASATASVSVVKDYHAERCIGLWNASTDLIDDVTGRARPTGKPLSTRKRTTPRDDSRSSARSQPTPFIRRYAPGKGQVDDHNPT